MADKYAAALDYARKLGAEHGTNAAAWYTQDAFGGRVTRGADESARRILDGIECGDPAILDTFPQADLSGEWADSLTGPMLTHDAIVHAGMRHANGNSDPDPFGHAPGACEVCDVWDAQGELHDAYESAFAEACESAIAEAARAALPEDEAPTDTAAIAAMRDEDGTLPAFAWPGGYPILYWTADGSILCPKCANSSEHPSDPPMDGGVYWEGEDETCVDCGASIPSAYGDPDAQD